LVVFDLFRLALLAAHSRALPWLPNLFHRKQLALFQERKVKPRRPDDSTRWMMATLNRLFPWRRALVKCETRYADPLAPQRISPVLALDVEADRTTAPTQAASAVDPRDGHGESLLGPGTHRQWVRDRQAQLEASLEC
jgi:hypothetical protein